MRLNVEGIVCLWGGIVYFGKGEPPHIGWGWAQKVEGGCQPFPAPAPTASNADLSFFPIPFSVVSIRGIDDNGQRTFGN